MYLSLRKHIVRCEDAFSATKMNKMRRHIFLYQERIIEEHALLYHQCSLPGARAADRARPGPRTDSGGGKPVGGAGGATCARTCATCAKPEGGRAAAASLGDSLRPTGDLQDQAICK